MDREQLIAIYQDTKAKCSDLEIPKSEKKKYEPSAYPNDDYSGVGDIIVEPLDTVSAIAKYIAGARGKVAILNMANAKHKGGGVERGAMAQEECLFRCSNLFTIPDEFYPLGTEEYIYTHQATFIKGSDYGTIWPMNVDVITIAAPNLNKDFKGNEISKELLDNYEDIMTKKIYSMIYSAFDNECKVLILGAWGCGAFKNDPNAVAKLFKNVLEKERYLFDKVIFAVINDRNSVGNNYQIFADTFNE